MGEHEDNFVPVTLARWSPTLLSIDEPSAVRSAVEFLKDLKRFLNVDLFDVNHWSPTLHHIDWLRFALNSGEVRWVKDALQDSFDQPMPVSISG